MGTIIFRVVENGTNPLRPLGNVQVTISQAGRTIATGKTGADGNYSPTGLVSGKFQFEASLNGYLPAKVDFTLSDNDLKQDVHLKKAVKSDPKVDTKLSIRIIEAGSNPVRPLIGAQIVISQKGGNLATGKSGADGHFLPAIATAGTYQVEVSLTGHQTVQTSIVVTDQLTTHDISIKPTKN